MNEHKTITCPKCGSTNVWQTGQKHKFRCLQSDCSHEFLFDPNGSAHYSAYLPAEELERMRDFLTPILKTQQDANAATIATKDCVFTGMLLYSRLMCAYTAVIALDPLLMPFKVFFQLIKEGKQSEAMDYILDQEESIVALATRSKEASDNVDLTTTHLLQFFEEHGVDVKETPYRR